ncbi:hypothetical protein HHTV1_32 [Haloarcula hispanica tailed virus 1]|uniref:Uncharacterized protein n=1 Tax=Haloarcula hispanica tailed virus 1 TaxID=1273750 RepID=R4TKT7_9CAUD|nr:hypothetical protein M198_gp32 [Haloarcula hispanica tailed virus 1]AGM11287.1 hypothetical protein HHTV1_32 [Haloarcula hispanica tailed virus 1]
MGTSSKSGIGKDPSEVDESLPSDEQVLEHLEQQQAEAESEAEESAPSRHELHQLILDQRESMERMQAVIEEQAERIDSLERQVEDVEFEATTVQEVAESLKEGKIGGEAGAEFIQQFIEVPDHGSKIDARATQLFLNVIRENRVGTPVTSSDVVQWIGLEDSSNPSVQAKRVMKRLVEHREDGFYLGEIELKKHRGKNCIWLAE